MNIFRIRILVDDQDGFIRELEIKSNQTFKTLHDFIVKNIKLGGKELASFQIIDDNWKKLQEITLMDMSGEVDKKAGKADAMQPIFLMDRTRLDVFLKEIGQMFIYEYDFLQMHTFQLEIFDIAKADDKKKYPEMIYSKGTLVLRENVKVEQDPDKLKQKLLHDFNSMFSDDDDDDDDFDVGGDDY